jgi:hypothetical protein
MRGLTCLILVATCFVAGCTGGNNSADIKVRAPGVKVDVERDKGPGGGVKVDVDPKGDR